MFLVGIFQWWYGAGWRRHMQRVGLGVLRTADFFSIGLLVRTLFDPFRQISAGQVRAQAPLAVKMPDCDARERVQRLRAWGRYLRGMDGTV